jgi:predicted dehydrogenase
MTPSTAPFRIIIAGFGWWGQHMARRLSGNTKIKLLGIAEPDEARHAGVEAAGLAVYPSFEAALDDPNADGVVLTTPNLLHESQVAAAAATGKHVLCEKPLGLTAASARRSVEACKRAGVQLGVGHERRYEPAMLQLKAALAEGQLGTIMHAEAAFSHDKLIGVPKGDWRTSKAIAPAAGMTAMGIHLTDLLISFFGRVETVQAITADRILGWETGDVATVQLGFVEGMTATLSAVLYTPHFIRMHIFGTKRWIQVLNDTHPDTPGGNVRYMVAETGKDIVETSLEWTDSVVANLEAFAAAAQGKAPYPISTEEMVHNIEVLEAVANSAERRETVHLGSG